MCIGKCCDAFKQSTTEGPFRTHLLLLHYCRSHQQAMSKEEAFTIRAKVFEELGWDHLVEGENKWAVIGHPKAFPLF